MQAEVYKHFVHTVVFENVTLVESDLVVKLLGKLEPVSDSGKAVVEQLIEAFDKAGKMA